MSLPSVNVNTDGNKEDSNEAEVDDGVNQNSRAACMHIPKLNHFALSRYLKQQPRAQ